MKIYIETLGCSKNLVDSEIMTNLFTKNQHRIVLDPEIADIIVVNTCGFIEDAKKESIDEIFNLAQLKKDGNCKKLIVTGCLSERYSETLAKEIPEVDAFLGTTTFQNIIKVVDQLLGDETQFVNVGNIDEMIYDHANRELLTPSHFAYVKIAEGCDNKCTYCIIPKLRGKFRSRKMEDIVDEVKGLLAKGVKEVILIAQDTARYGIDLYDAYKLAELLNRLGKIKDLKWIRIQYAYPDVIDHELINEIRDNDKVVKYLDIPIQHGNDEILKRMNRKITVSEIESLINELRNKIEDIVIRTTLIVGFPGETEEQFNDLYNFVEKISFDRLGVFAYSDEEDTPAYELTDKIPQELKEERRKKIMMLQKDISEEKNQSKIDQVFEVLIEEKLENENIYLGRTAYDSPEIDGIVYVHTDDELEIGSFVDVTITGALEYDLLGDC